METEYWVLSIIAIVLALVAGFIGGRMSAPRQRRVEAMEQERDTAREEAEAVRAEVNRHFEESARMFGKLASDYRTFFQQFAQTAQNLGLSEGRARELLEEADPNLVARQTNQPASAAPASTGTGEPDAAPGEEPATDNAGADGPTPSADAPEAPAAAAAPEGDERPGDGDRDEAPADHEAERDRRG
jgi:uncharacterized membrane-anchored protein YhcB (DUF1043 family)